LIAFSFSDEFGALHAILIWLHEDGAGEHLPTTASVRIRLVRALVVALHRTFARDIRRDIAIDDLLWGRDFAVNHDLRTYHQVGAKVLEEDPFDAFLALGHVDLVLKLEFLSLLLLFGHFLAVRI